MSPHHVASIDNLIAAFREDASVQALILGGSLAHGFAREDSDIDVAIVVSSGEFARRRTEGRLHYNNRTLCTYPGYIDGKYMDLAFLRLVAERGSDPARYAFKDSRVLFSRIPGLDAVLAAIVRYPMEARTQRVERFVAQLLAWRWYYSEAVRQESAYLTILAVQKVVLFTARILLAHNATFFPYHKWMLRVLATVPEQPPGLGEVIDDLLRAHTWEKIDRHCREIIAFVGLDFAAADATWPSHFMRDTELRWMDESPAIDEL